MFFFLLLFILASIMFMEEGGLTAGKPFVRIVSVQMILNGEILYLNKSFCFRTLIYLLCEMKRNGYLVSGMKVEKR